MQEKKFSTVARKRLEDAILCVADEIVASIWRVLHHLPNSSYLLLTLDSIYCACAISL